MINAIDIARHHDRNASEARVETNADACEISLLREPDVSTSFCFAIDNEGNEESNGKE